ncbi:hypothetical protein, partial [Parabacteroides sp. AF48-14]|uniref:hypothetical protein n=1 Tax=Parabacteroides sp. AF48-14 TaxID=2292052 RepID=UPI001F3BD99D
GLTALRQRCHSGGSRTAPTRPLLLTDKSSFIGSYLPNYETTFPLHCPTIRQFHPYPVKKAVDCLGCPTKGDSFGSLIKR